MRRIGSREGDGKRGTVSPVRKGKPGLIAEELRGANNDRKVRAGAGGRESVGT